MAVAYVRGTRGYYYIVVPPGDIWALADVCAVQMLAQMPCCSWMAPGAIAVTSRESINCAAVRDSSGDALDHPLRPPCTLY